MRSNVHCPNAILLPHMTIILLILSFLIVNLTSVYANAAERGRVTLQNGTVYTDRGTMIRGMTMAIMYGPGNSRNNAYWQYMNKTLKMNAVRLGVKTGQIGRTVQQQLTYIDYVVDSAAKNDMYVMINNSVLPGNYDINQLTAFWSAVAPRYANRTHVFYEMTNEPVQGGPVWGNPTQFTSKVLSDFEGLYNLMRRGAPNTHIVLFPTPNLWPDCATYAAFLDKLKWPDWSKTSLGYHHYQGTERFGEDNLKCLRAKYPLLMTETNYWMRRDVANMRYVLNMYEKLGMSWFSLDGKGNAPYLENQILPQLQRDGYSWDTAG